MNSEDLLIISAWKEAESEFGITVQTPALVQDSDGKLYEYLALIVGFGSKNGTLICSNNVCPSGNSKEDNYNLAILSGDFYGSFNKAYFAETLIDWAWYGPEGEGPDWME
ncbi:hypothetical protein [Sulfurovum sp.]|uniref:hypothetical protein n=1 Tax=Sulfurovum sp. TaxID=1969726 RepID=UPI003563C7FC